MRVQRSQHDLTFRPDRPALESAWRVLTTTRRDWLGQLGAGALVLATPMLARAAAQSEADTYDEASTLKAAVDFFGQTTEGLAQVIAKAFREQGRPNGYVRGEEVAAAVTAGVRYGEGELVMKSGSMSKVYWAGPSIGFDLGANAAKVFVLVYNLPGPSAIFKRYPGRRRQSLLRGRRGHQLPAPGRRHAGAGALGRRPAGRGERGLHPLPAGEVAEPAVILQH